MDLSAGEFESYRKSSWIRSFVCFLCRRRLSVSVWMLTTVHMFTTKVFLYHRLRGVVEHLSCGCSEVIKTLFIVYVSEPSHDQHSLLYITEVLSELALTIWSECFEVSGQSDGKLMSPLSLVFLLHVKEKILTSIETPPFIIQNIGNDFFVVVLNWKWILIMQFL